MTPHFENYFTEHASLLGEVLFFHLTLEALLTEIIKRDSGAMAESKLNKIMFAKKADECLKLGRLSPELHEAVLALNKVRNQYAHELGYEISFDAALGLAKVCGKAGAEFTDGVDRCTIDQAKELGYDTLDLLNEAFRNTFFEVAYQQGEEPWLEFTS
jgi:hypothetical protein